MHVPVLAEASRPRAPTSVAWIPPPTRAGRRHPGTHTWMASFSVEHAFNIVNVSRMIVCPRLLLSSALIKYRAHTLLDWAAAKRRDDRNDGLGDDRVERLAVRAVARLHRLPRGLLPKRTSCVSHHLLNLWLRRERTGLGRCVKGSIRRVQRGRKESGVERRLSLLIFPLPHFHECQCSLGSWR